MIVNQNRCVNCEQECSICLINDPIQVNLCDTCQENEAGYNFDGVYYCESCAASLIKKEYADDILREFHDQIFDFLDINKIKIA